MQILPTGDLSVGGIPLRYEGRDEHGFISAEMLWDGNMHVWLKSEVEDGKEAWTSEGRSEPDCCYMHIWGPIATLRLLLEFAETSRKIFQENGQWYGEKDASNDANQGESTGQYGQQEKA